MGIPKFPDDWEKRTGEKEGKPHLHVVDMTKHPGVDNLTGYIIDSEAEQRGVSKLIATQQILAGLGQPGHAPFAQLTTKQLVEAFARANVPLADRTLENYAANVREFAVFVGGAKPLHEIEPLDISSYKTYLERFRAKKLSKSSVKQQLASIRYFYRWLANQYPAENITDPTTTIDRPKPDPHQGRIVEWDDLKLLLEDRGGTDRELVTMWLLAFTGARTSELRNLRWRNVDFKSGLMKLFGKGNKERTIAVHSELLPVLWWWHEEMHRYNENPKITRALKDEETAFVLLTNNGTQLGEREIWRALKRRAARLGIRTRAVPEDYSGKRKSFENTADITPHDLRRNFATRVLRAGGSLDSLADILGHVSVDTTRTHYAFTSKRRTINTMHLFSLRDADEPAKGHET